MWNLIKRSRIGHAWINQAFNYVDADRIKAVGADRAAAEWIVKNGGKVKSHNSTRWIGDYNSFVSGAGKSFKLAYIDAPELDITAQGCKHFDDLKHIKDCSFRGCGLFDDAGLAIVIRNSYQTLESLDVAYTAVTWKGLALLSVVEKLKVLTVDNKVVGGKQGELKIALQGCDILILDKT